MTTAFTHRIGIDGKLFSGERFYPGDQVPEDIDLALLQKLRNINWVQDVPADQWKPPSDEVVTARRERLEAVERERREEGERQQRLLEERQRDPVWQAERRISVADEAVRAAERARSEAIRERNRVLTEPV